MPQNVTLLRNLFLLYFTGRGKHNFRVSNLIPWEICKIDFYPYLLKLNTLLKNLVEKSSTNFELVSLETLDFISIFLMYCFLLVDPVYLQTLQHRYYICCGVKYIRDFVHTIRMRIKTIHRINYFASLI